jgi:hypothetical protein
MTGMLTDLLQKRMYSFLMHGNITFYMQLMRYCLPLLEMTMILKLIIGLTCSVTTKTLERMVRHLSNGGARLS